MKTNATRLAVGLLFVLAAVCSAGKPSANYGLASKFSSPFIAQRLYSTSVRPNWINGSDRFWYSYRTSDGTLFYFVDPLTKKKEPLFDRDALAAQLSEAVKKPLSAKTLPLTSFRFNKDESSFYFRYSRKWYQWHRQDKKLTAHGTKMPADATATSSSGATPRSREALIRQARARAQRGGRDHRSFSADKKWYAFAKGYNLYLAEKDKEDKAIQLSKDSVKDYSFAFRSTEKKSRPYATWSADSKAFYALRRDQRGVKELYLVNSLAQPRPTLMAYKYPMPGEDNVRRSELFVYHHDTKKFLRVAPKWKDESYTNVHFADKKSDELRFLRRDRSYRNVELCSLNPKTGECKTLIAESFEGANVAYQTVRYINEGKEMVWWSERSGWGHFYLYDRDGKLKNAITTGPFRASRIAAIDEKHRLLFFYANGREKDENIYYEHLYKVQLDGSGLTLLDAGNATHRSSLSPTKKYLVDNCSRVDMAPRVILRDTQGNKLMELEAADLSRLEAAGWKMPQRFIVKATDGITDLYGNMWTPFDLDPKKRYPIIVYVYPGPQQEGVTHTFSPTARGRQALANLGFVVIQVGHRGGTPKRSKAYHSYGYYNLRDYGLADKKTAIEQLAARFKYIDINRIGIYGHSGGGFMTAAALLQKPYNDFFKVGVASSGNHDNNVYGYYWAERYHGLKEAKVQTSKQSTSGSRSQSGRTGSRRSSTGKKDTTKKDTTKKDTTKKDTTKKDTTKKETTKKDTTKKDATKKDTAKKKQPSQRRARRRKNRTPAALKTMDDADEVKQRKRARRKARRARRKEAARRAAQDAARVAAEQEQQASPVVTAQDKKDAKKQAQKSDKVEKKSEKKVEKKSDKKDTRKTVAKKDQAKKNVEAKKTQAKKTAVKKTAVKKTEVKKTEVKKTEVKKTEVKKSDKKKTEVKKTETKKTEVKKTETKKTETAKKKSKYEIKVPTNAELAGNLKGRLLLVHGEMDNNVHPAGTMRLADALIKANKRFDMLIIPGKRHSYGDAQTYFTQRMWEYFAQHLLGEQLEGADIGIKR